MARKSTKKARKKSTKKKAAPRASRSTRRGGGGRVVGADYPRHSPKKALRIPKAILDQHAGRSCTDREAADFCGVKYHGPFRVELSSSLKYGLLERPEQGHVQPTDLAKTILRPKAPEDELTGLRQAVVNAPKISEVYQHYRGENIPDARFFANTLTDKFGIPAEKVEEFRNVFGEALEESELVERHGDKQRLIDISQASGVTTDPEETLKKIGKGVKIVEGDTCFVMMPFKDPIGSYYKSIYEPAIKEAGLTPVRADDDIFSTGKIMEQIWDGIGQARVLVAELTDRNPNVFYELGLAHALNKPVVLVSSNEQDVPFDLTHIRVIYCDKDDPFWGQKLVSKIAENVLSALKNPEEALFRNPED